MNSKDIKAAIPPQKTGLKVCVFCSAKDLPATYTEPAQEFARLLAENGHSLVWGGSDTGLMKIVAAGAQAGGAKIVGISMEALKDRARKNADEMIIAKDLGERKALMLERSDVIVMMVGGIGTLDEMTEVLERMGQEGFMPRALEDMVTFANSSEEVVHYINDYQQQTR
jgi:uncharacterized protein (TIGR00730 family)